LAIGLINEALDEGDAQKTLQALQIPAAKLEGVLAEVAQHYQDTLIRAKREKAQVSHPPPLPLHPPSLLKLLIEI
jgi:Ras GTPase-activating-like protein IQGAP1